MSLKDRLNSQQSSTVNKEFSKTHIKETQTEQSATCYIKKG